MTDVIKTVHATITAQTALEMIGNPNAKGTIVIAPTIVIVPTIAPMISNALTAITISSMTLATTRHGHFSNVTSPATRLPHNAALPPVAKTHPNRDRHKPIGASHVQQHQTGAPKSHSLTPPKPK